MLSPMQPLPRALWTFAGILSPLLLTGRVRAVPWVQDAYIKASNAEGIDPTSCPGGNNTGCSVDYLDGDWFGRSVAVSGDIMAVGAPFEDSDAAGVNGNDSNNKARDSGAAYIFVREGKAWRQEAYLKADGPGDPANSFGVSVAVSGTTVAVGEASSVSVFVRDGGVWRMEARLKGTNTAMSDSFGASVSISGDTLVAGAPGEDSSATGVNPGTDNNGAEDSGAAYVFVRSGGRWTQQALLKASNTGAGDHFGTSVAVSGDTVVIGADGEDSGATGVNGNQTGNSEWQSGAGYVFVRNGGAWSQQAYLKASNTGGGGSSLENGDYFGGSVAVSGDTIVAGAYGEESSATGVNGNQAGNSAAFAGAAYVFVRTGGLWSQQAYLKASNTGSGDIFGAAAAISGDLIVIGAMSEDSDSGGINGDGSNNRRDAAGAAYVFARENGYWSQRAYLKSAWPGSKDLFGASVGVSGGLVVIGARGEDSEAVGVNGDQTDNDAPEAGAAFVFSQPPPPPITGIDRLSSGVRLRMPAAGSPLPGVQYSENLLPGSWIDIGSFTASGAMAEFLDTSAVRMSRPHGYYRSFQR